MTRLSFLALVVSLHLCHDSSLGLQLGLRVLLQLENEQCLVLQVLWPAAK